MTLLNREQLIATLQALWGPTEGHHSGLVKALHEHIDAQTTKIDFLKAQLDLLVKCTDQDGELIETIQAERDAALKERDGLKEELEARITGVHSCNAKCRIPVCVFRRERDAALARVKELEGAIKAVCCNPDGEVVIEGSDEDRAILQSALTRDTRASEGA